MSILFPPQKRTIRVVDDYYFLQFPHLLADIINICDQYSLYIWFSNAKGEKLSGICLPNCVCSNPDLFQGYVCNGRIITANSDVRTEVKVFWQTKYGYFDDWWDAEDHLRNLFGSLENWSKLTLKEIEDILERRRK